MKRLGLLTAMVFVTTFLLHPGPARASDLGDLRISLLDGDVQMKTADTEDWVPASINTPLMAGDVLWVPEGGRAGVQVKDGTVLRLNENTSLEILTLEEGSYQFHLTMGQAYVNFIGRPNTFLQMDTPVTSMRAFDPSVFRIDVSEDGFTDVSVFSGSVQVENRGGEATVSSGNTLSLGENDYAEFSMDTPGISPATWGPDIRTTDRRIGS